MKFKAAYHRAIIGLSRDHVLLINNTRLGLTLQKLQNTSKSDSPSQS